MLQIQSGKYSKPFIYTKYEKGKTYIFYNITHAWKLMIMVTSREGTQRKKEYEKVGFGLHKSLCHPFKKIFELSYISNMNFIVIISYMHTVYLK
jgi:hypothetical protein